MKRILKTLIVAAFLFVGVATLFASGADVSANAIDDACAQGGANAICQGKDEVTVMDVVGIVVNTLLFIIGLLSVIMIIVGGIRYTTSAGDTSAVTAAKNTILYAVVGLVVAFVAFAIVNWVLQLFVPAAPPVTT